jgi:hypothetical protein
MWSPRALVRLNWSRYFQSTVLFSVYSLVALPIALVPGTALALLYLAFESYLGMNGGGPAGASNPFNIPFSVASLLMAYGISWMILRPLAYLFVYSSKYPHKAALKYETLNMEQHFNKVFFRGNTINLASAPSEYTILLKRELTILMARWRLSERSLARTSPERLESFLEERRVLAGDLIQYRIYLERGRDDSLLAMLNRIELGHMLAGDVD